MTRLDRVKRVDPSQADGYAELGRRLLHAGRAIVEQGDPRHTSALAILSIHAAIAFADAVTIHSAGRKSTSADHHAAPRLLSATLGDRVPPAIGTALARLVAEKDRFEYQGHLATMREGQSLYAHAERIGAWADGVLIATRRSNG